MFQRNIPSPSSRLTIFEVPLNMCRKEEYEIRCYVLVQRTDVGDIRKGKKGAGYRDWH
jgi:hypothetical protein